MEFEEGKVSLLLLFGDCSTALKQFEGKVDAWYLDGFSPAKNEEMWSADVFKQLAWHSHDKTTLATFTAAGFVRRGLESVGFKIERIKGFGFKKHMTVGQYTGHVKEHLHIEPWYQSENNKFEGSVAVIGAGIAGASLARNLSRAGYEVTLFEAENSAAAKASGNKRGMVYPLISKKVDRLGSFSEIATHHCWNLVNDLGIECREGIYEFLTENKKSDRFEEAISRYKNDYLELVERPEISRDFPAVYHKRGLSFAPKELVFSLLEQANVKLEYSKKLAGLKRVKGEWQLSFTDGKKQCFTNVFMCNAFDSKMFGQLEFLPLRISRGQVCSLPESAVKKSIDDLNYVHYLTKASSEFLLGATFDVDDPTEKFRVEDSQQLVNSVNKKFPGLLDENLKVNELTGRVCFRTVTHDYFPIAGPVPDLKYFDHHYSALKHGKPVSDYPQAQSESGLFVSVGHGSRGLAFAPLSSTYLTKLLRDGVHILPVQHIQTIHPARFLIKKYKKGSPVGEP